MLVSSDVDENAVYATTESAVRAISWLIPFGLYPVKSEGYGASKPYTVWAITGLTVMVTVMVWITMFANNGGANSTKNLMMWAGREPTATDIERGREISEFTHWGDTATFDRKVGELENRKVPRIRPKFKPTTSWSPISSSLASFTGIS